MLCNNKSYEEPEYIILEGVGRQGLKVKIVQYFFLKLIYMRTTSGNFEMLCFILLSPLQANSFSKLHLFV